MRPRVAKQNKVQLANRRSPDWAFMERFVVPDYAHPDTDDDYLTRVRLIQTPLFGVYLHKLETADPRPTLHDHPWPFLAIVLRGGYDEMRRDTHVVKPGDTRTFVDGRVEILPHSYAHPHRVKRINWMPFQALHWIDKLHRTPTWTLVIVGRRTRVWGYLDRDGKWTAFDKHPFNDQFLTALAERKKRKLGREVTEGELVQLNQWDKRKGWTSDADV